MPTTTPSASRFLGMTYVNRPLKVVGAKMPKRRMKTNSTRMQIFLLSSKVSALNLICHACKAELEGVATTMETMATIMDEAQQLAVSCLGSVEDPRQRDG